MKKIIIIAGPQSSGKTTTFNFLKTIYKEAVFVEEINPYFFVKKHLGGALTDKKLEKKIIAEDFKILSKLKNIKKSLIFIETGIFHIVYAEKIIGKETVDYYFKKYLNVYKYFEPIIIFIDTQPRISWKRRKNIYKKRLINAGIKTKEENEKFLKKYQKNIDDLYPMWIKWLNRFSYKKILIKNSYKSKRKFLEEAERKIGNLLKSTFTP